MGNESLSLEEALAIAKEAELKAARIYMEASAKATNPMGKKLLEQLADFENYHYRKLVELEESLRQKGEFIEYESRSMQFSVPPETGDKAQELEAKSVAAILATAIDIEKAAEERYKTLAERTDDPRGKAMFQKLALEEHYHYRILSDEFYAISNRGVWVWSE
ncbi:MAG: ferritin family protein [Anaerolineae bacterium]|nr:ferritin family protein [Anaerolineae bacterium]MDW8102775.1 ferritin family protein [Anaerolineae bacterium]